MAPAELTLAMIVASRRNIALEAERMRRGDWPCTLSHRLRGSRSAFSGSARSARWWRRPGRGLGMKVLVWGRKDSLEKARGAGYEAAASKAELFARADVLSLTCGLTPETRGIVGPEDLARMKPTALFVNTARAELIQPGALVDALQKGRPGYAAVDVYEEEPIIDGRHPLLAMPNVLCTPHLGWAEWANFELYFAEMFEQIVAYEQRRDIAPRQSERDAAPRLRRAQAPANSPTASATASRRWAKRGTRLRGPLTSLSAWPGWRCVPAQPLCTRSRITPLMSWNLTS